MTGATTGTVTSFAFGRDRALEYLRERVLTVRELHAIARWQARLSSERGDRQSRAEWLGAAWATRDRGNR